MYLHDGSKAALAYSSGPLACATRARDLGLTATVVFTGPTVATQVMAAACNGTFNVVIVERLAVLADRPLDALRLAAQIGSLGVQVISAAGGEEW